MSTNDENEAPEPTPSGIDSAALEEATDPTAPLKAGLKYGVCGLGILIVAGLLIWWPWKGVPGLWGVLIGAAIGGGFILITVITILLTAKASPTVVMGALMGGYLVKVVIVIAVTAILKDMTFYNKGALVSMLIGAIVLVLGSELWGVLTTRQTYIAPESDTKA
ncbi:hypothetical protein [Gordonia neofelifaecis]|uniref:ATP synthase protein I n=1 Tax=Gordonia neofelifaecis NRRL B-59395 TaxID=644548 RepID=F1YFC2_9ACTN|nr:hypothetical protein [Gordonia neofelifaecis]EGD56694.1 hypothetical protein SCNU_04047 [Gordonia neofelifaecis NRRL B-59395]